VVVLAASGLTIAGLVALFAVLFWRLASRFDARACTIGWLDSFSLERYVPMERLLDKSELVFLRSQPGYRPELEKELLAERRKIFVSYLNLLVRDFNQILGIAKLMLVQSREDHPEFSRALWRQQASFYFAVLVIRSKVAVYPVGWTPVDVPGLLCSLDNLRNHVREITHPGPAPEPAI
jgi:hypothetical protein